MRFDVRYPIGLLFLVIGAMVAVRGMTLSSAGPQLAGGPSSGEIDLYWGAVMEIFGLVMLVLAALASRRQPPQS